MPAETDRHERTLMCVADRRRGARRSGTTSSTRRGRCTPTVARAIARARAGDDGRRTRATRTGAACRVRPRRGSARPADRRLVDPRLGPDHRPRTPTPPGTPCTSGSTRGARSTRRTTRTRRSARASPRTLGLPVYDAPLVLEGGSIAVDGAGIARDDRTLPPQREPQPRDEQGRDRGRAPALARCRPDRLAARRDRRGRGNGRPRRQRRGLRRDRRACCLQGCADPDNPNHAIAADNRGRLDAGRQSRSSRSRRCRTPTVSGAIASRCRT